MLIELEVKTQEPLAVDSTGERENSFMLNLCQIAIAQAFGAQHGVHWLDTPATYSMLHDGIGKDGEHLVYKVVAGHRNDPELHSDDVATSVQRVLEYHQYVQSLRDAGIRVPDIAEMRLAAVPLERFNGTGKSVENLWVYVERQSYIPGVTDYTAFTSENYTNLQCTDRYRQVVKLAHSISGLIGERFGIDFQPGNIIRQEDPGEYKYIDFFPPKEMGGVDQINRNRMRMDPWHKWIYESSFTFRGALKYIFVMYTALRPALFDVFRNVIFLENEKLESENQRLWEMDSHTVNPYNSYLPTCDFTRNSLEREFGFAVFAYDRYGIDVRPGLSRYGIDFQTAVHS